MVSAAGTRIGGAIIAMDSAATDSAIAPARVPRTRCRAHSRAEEHEADLRDRRPGEKPAPVALRQRDDRREQRRDGADHPGRDERVRVQDRSKTQEQQDAGGGDARLDQRRRGRAGVRGLGQPHVERELRRPRERREEDEQRRNEQRRLQLRDRIRLVTEATDALRELPDVGGAEGRDVPEDRDEQRRVPHARDDERAQRGGRGGRPVAAVRDEQVGPRGQQLPSREEQQEIAGGDDEQERARREAEGRAETPGVRALLARAERREPHEQHDRGQADEHRDHRGVDTQGEVGSAQREPYADLRDERGPARHEGLRDRERGAERERQPGDEDRAAESAHTPAEEREDGRGKERERDDEDERQRRLDHGGVIPMRSLPALPVQSTAPPAIVAMR
jgi:hypothetical protein